MLLLLKNQQERGEKSHQKIEYFEPKRKYQTIKNKYLSYFNFSLSHKGWANFDICNTSQISVQNIIEGKKLDPSIRQIFQFALYSTTFWRTFINFTIFDGFFFSVWQFQNF